MSDERPPIGDAPEPGVEARLISSAARPVIEISHLRKTYGSTVAVDDVSLSVAQGEIFGILGPNGAGKTTTVECAIGVRLPNSGSVRILGLDPIADRERLHLEVGVQLQASALQPRLRVGEILDPYRSFYPNPADVGELAQMLGLAEKRDDYYRSLSGGQKQRLSIALALVGRPRVAVLDEMTTGLDPQARRDTWELIEHVRDRGVTIVLVTHYMDEAERLCDRVALMDAGRIVALDSPCRLVEQVAGAKQMSFVPSGMFDRRLLRELPEVSAIEDHDGRVVVGGSGDLVSVVILRLADAGVFAHDVRLSSADLEDAFVKLTGRHPDAPHLSAPQPRRGDRAGRPTTAGVSSLPKSTPRAAFGALLLNELRLAWRQPIGVLFGLALPVLLLLIFGSVSSLNKPEKVLGGLTWFDIYVPVLIVLVIAIIGLVSLPIPLATYREQGILRGLSTTPLPPAWVLGAQLMINIGIATAALTILMLGATVVFGFTTPASVAGFAISILLAITAVFAIGLWITGVARTAAAAGGIGTIIFYPLMFLAGLFVPRQELSATLRHIGDWTPLGAAVTTVQHASQTGFPSAKPLLILAAYAVVFAGLAVHHFKWE